MTPNDWIGRRVADTVGRPYGTLDELFVGRVSGEPEFGIVSVADADGEGTRRVAVPLTGGRRDGDVVVLPLDPDRVRAAPAVQRDVESIPPDAGARIAEFFAGPGDPTTPMPPTAPAPATTPAPAAIDDEVDVTVSEEELVVDKSVRATERVRVRKVVVEEDVTVTVTLRHEELVIEREAVHGADADDAGRGTGDQQLSEGMLEFVLLAEEPVVEKRVVAVERVKVARDTIVEQRRITDQVRKERVEVDETAFPEEPHHP